VDAGIMACRIFCLICGNSTIQSTFLEGLAYWNMENPVQQMALPLTGRQLRDKAMASVEKNAGWDWNVMALDVVKKVATRNHGFICDDVHEAAEKLGLRQPHDPRAWGPIMKKAVTLGICEKTGTYIPTRRPSRHGAPVAVYRSRIYQSRAS
jgi:hypothetical protein